MKNLYLIGGTMGVGKTAACQKMKQKLRNSVFLDGDWCWDANPFTVTDETKAMVMKNICFLLQSFINCSAYEHVIFCWVMHEQSIIDDILSRLDTSGCDVKAVSLIINETSLRERLQKGINAGIRQRDTIERSLERIKLYDAFDTVKIDVSNLTAEQVAERVTNI